MAGNTIDRSVLFQYLSSTEGKQDNISLCISILKRIMRKFHYSKIKKAGTAECLLNDIRISSENSESQGTKSQNISEMKFSGTGKKKYAATRTLLELLEVR